MDRKEFFTTCAAGLCACAAGTLVPVSSLTAAQAAPPEDAKLRFARQRYAGLIKILSQRLDEKAMNEVLQSLGGYCAGLWDQTILKYRGNIEGFRNLLKQSSSGDDFVWDREKGIITMSSPERSDCFCALISKQTTPAVACNCSLGWQQHTWEILLEKKVRVELKESVLRGGKRCVFEIHV